MGYFAWFRDSSLVAVQDVRVEGAQGTDRDRIAGALTRAARDMTTLHLQPEQLQASVRGFPSVASVSADPSFPHGLTIHVGVRRPALVGTSGGHEVPVSPDGWLLPGVDAPKGLPRLPVDSLAGTGRLKGDPLEEALALGAAPAPLRALIEGVALDADYGVVVTLHGSIALRFGTGAHAAQKWAAAAAVLADPGVTGLSYIDLRVPQRPAVGGV